MRGKLPTTTHHVGFTIGTVDWCAEVEVDDDGWELKWIGMDIGGGKVVGCIEGEDMDLHYAKFEANGYNYGVSHFRDIAHFHIERKHDTLMEAHAAEVGQNEIDARADHRRESRDD